VVNYKHDRLVVTAAHCLPHFPPCHGASYLEERTYGKLLGPLGDKPTVWAECLCADPIADIAVLGSPDNQALFDGAGALGYFAQPTPEAQATYRQKHAEILEDSVEDEPSQPEATKRQTFQVAFVLHLSQLGLLERKMAATWDGPTIETGYEITDLGRLLIEQILH
jgi:hypothetical protein